MNQIPGILILILALFCSIAIVQVSTAFVLPTAFLVMLGIVMLENTH